MPVQQIILKIPLEVSRPQAAPPDVAALMQLVNSTPPDAAPEKFPFVHSARRIFQALVALGNARVCPGKAGRKTFSQWHESMSKMPVSDPKAERRLAKQDPLFWAGITALKGIEVARIRQCMICENFFWAARRDKKCCTAACGHVWRTRRCRERYVDRYKQRRIRKAEQADPMGLKEKWAKEERERQQVASLKKGTRPHRRAPRLPNPVRKKR